MLGVTAMIGQFTPALVCDEEILPFRLVRLNDRNEGSIADAVGDGVIGVTDGSCRAFDDTAHANTGESLRLQPGRVVLCEAGAAITAPAWLCPSTAGLCKEASASTEAVFGRAMEDAADANEVIRVMLVDTAHLTGAGTLAT